MTFRRGDNGTAGFYRIHLLGNANTSLYPKADFNRAFRLDAPAP